MEGIVVCSGGAVDVEGVPEEVKILPIGHVKSQKGDFEVDDESVEMIQKQFKSRRIDIVIDYEHQTLKDVQAPASGWIKDIYKGKDAVIAKVQWTDRAKEYLKNKEYRYLSPVVMVRKSDRKAAALHSAALTNTPAIDGMIPIINSLEHPFSDEVALDETQKKICRILNISESDFINYGMRAGSD